MASKYDPIGKHNYGYFGARCHAPRELRPPSRQPPDTIVGAVSIERSRVVSAAAERELADARALLGELRETLARVPATHADAATLAGAIRQLDDLFLIVVVGEFNSGKSAFINALAGAGVLEEGVTPTTAEIQLVRYGEAIGSSRDATGLRVVTAPVELLRDLHIVDTPGTNAIVREHERLTLDFMPRADLVLFVTSADRPFTETERVFLDVIRDWGKKIVLVVNKIDILERESERAEVLGFVRESASRLLNVVPEVFAVSARLAMRAKQIGTADLRASGFEPLEQFVRETLDDKSRFHLKLANPLGVGATLARRYEAVADERLRLLGDDVAALDDIDRQLSAYRDDLGRGFELRMAGVEKVLLEMEARGHTYFEDTLRVGRVFDLLNKPRIQREFEQRVVGDAPTRIDQLRLGDHRLAGGSGLPAVAGALGEALGAPVRARRPHSRCTRDRQLSRRSGEAARIGRARGAARGADLRSRPRIGSHRRRRADGRRRDRRGGCRSPRPRDRGDGGGHNGGDGRHGHARGRRNRRGRAAHHSGEATPGACGAARKGQRVCASGLPKRCRRSFRRRASVAAAVSTTAWRRTRASCEASSTGGGRRGRRWPGGVAGRLASSQAHDVAFK